MDIDCGLLSKDFFAGQYRLILIMINGRDFYCIGYAKLICEGNLRNQHTLWVASFEVVLPGIFIMSDRCETQENSFATGKEDANATSVFAGFVRLWKIFLSLL